MMAQQPDNAPNGPMLNMIWASMLASPIMIALPVHFFAGMAGIGGLAADTDIWFLAGGLAAAIISLPMMRRFREAVTLPRGMPRDAAYWQRVTAAMMPGMAVAELPFFIGFAGYLAGGFVETGAILLIVTLALQTRFKPPAS